jgi:hypothetical protein
VLQFLEHVEFLLGQIAAVVDPGEQVVERADLVRRQQDHPLVLDRAAGSDRALRAPARAVRKQQRGQDPVSELLGLDGGDAQDADRELGDRVSPLVC